MAWDIAVKTKVYHLLANEIFFRIYNGTYPPGVKLSSFPVFAKEVGSSPETVRKAIYELQKHGIVERNRLGFLSHPTMRKYWNTGIVTSPLLNRDTLKQSKR